MEYAFTHIGMFKTATTYMQNLWLNNENAHLENKRKRINKFGNFLYQNPKRMQSTIQKKINPVQRPIKINDSNNVFYINYKGENMSGIGKINQ